MKFKKVKVYDIDYEVSEDEIEETGKTEAEIIAELPEDYLLEVEDREDCNFDDFVREALENECGYFINDFKYIIIEEK